MYTAGVGNNHLHHFSSKLHLGRECRPWLCAGDGGRAQNESLRRLHNHGWKCLLALSQIWTLLRHYAKRVPMTFASASQFHVYLLWVNACFVKHSVLNVKAFNQKKALVGAFSVIVKTDCKTDGSFAAQIVSAAAGGANQPSTRLLLLTAGGTSNELPWTSIPNFSTIGQSSFHSWLKNQRSYFGPFLSSIS